MEHAGQAQVQTAAKHEWWSARGDCAEREAYYECWGANVGR